MPSGYVGVLICELHFPDAHSLKEKRHFVRSAKAQLQNRVGASVAEVDHHDVWQRAKLAAACVAREHRELERLQDEVLVLGSMVEKATLRAVDALRARDIPAARAIEAEDILINRKRFEIEDMVRGDCLFSATGVTDGAMLRGVKFRKHIIETETVVMRSVTGTVRRIVAEHRQFDKFHLD